MRLAIELHDGTIIELPEAMNGVIGRKFLRSDRDNLSPAARKWIWSALGEAAPVPKKMTLLLNRDDVEAAFPARHDI